MWKMGIDNVLYLASNPIDECSENVSPAFRENNGDSGIITMSDKEYKFGENVVRYSKIRQKTRHLP